jgi:hypothetical protein
MRSRPKPASSSGSREFDRLDRLFDEAMRDAVRAALREHKRRGESIVVWRNGKIVVIPPGRIRVR